MFDTLTRWSRALPGGRHVRGLPAGTLMLVFAVGSGAVMEAQFPPPARPPGSKAAAGGPAPAQSPSPLPSARSVLDRHLDAIGGRAAVLSHRSAHATGSLTMPSAGITGTLEIYGAAPNRSLLRISLSGVGEVVEAFDGRHGWSLSPMTGPMLLEGRQLEEKRFDAEFHSELRASDRYASMETVERTDFDGRPCYKLRLVRRTGGEDIEFYDVATGLKAGSITTRETQMGSVTGTTIERDYRKFGNLLQPTTVRSEVGGLQQVITIETYEYDTVAESVFDPPAGIKALLK